MLPFRGGQFNQFNNGSPVNRHVVLYPQQQTQIVQPPTLMYATHAQNFQQPYPVQQQHHHQQQQQQSFMFIPSQTRQQQPWIVQSAPPPPPTFIPAPQSTFHRIQTPLLPPPLTFGTGIPQPAFSGGTAISQQPFPMNSNVPPPSAFAAGTGIPQPAFSGGTAVLKRKSHYLDESEYDPPNNYNNETGNEPPPLMCIPSQTTFSPQQHFRPQNPRYNENRSRLPLPSTPSSNPAWIDDDRNTYSTSTHNDQQPQLLTSQLFQKHQLISIDTLLKEPSRSQRPAQIIIFLRGLPGSGKSYVADLIKNEEELQSKGNNKPKILSIDDYFLNENQTETKDPKTGKITKTSTMEYEYDPKMEETYRRSLIKLVRKSIDDRFYPFLIVDQNHEQIGHFRELVEYAESSQFHVYFVELTNDIQTCFQRNIHKRTLIDIEQINKSWEQLPLRHEILDIRSLLQSDAIDEVEMDDAPPTTIVTTTTTTEQSENVQTEEELENGDSQITKKSKWETMMETNPDRLDGLYQRRNHSPSPPIEKRLNNTTISIDEPSNDISSNLQSKKKKVRWADVEENTLHLHKKAVGFVVGQSEQDWQRMSDDYDPTQKLNQYKYI